jgi:glucoamylase
MHTSDTKLGVHIVDLATEKMPVGEKIVFTFRWDEDERWEGTDFTVVVE